MTDPSIAIQEENQGYDEKTTFLLTASGEIKQISSQIGQELIEQNMMLDDLGDQMENVKQRLDRYNEQMREITHSKEGPLFLISVILTLVLIFLLFWVIL